MTVEKAMFGAGCFWGVEHMFRQVEGVVSAESGYSGGSVENPTYEQVCTGRTGHAEVVQVTFDPARTSYQRLLEVFWNGHDPTTLNRQGPDRGTQYRSAIFYATPEQKKVAEAYVAQLDKAGVYGRPIVTRIDPLAAFYPAEGYHQDFLTLNPDYPYIVFNDLPKIANLKAMFPALYREKPALVSEAKS